MTRGPTRYVVRTPEQILPYCVIKTEHTGGSKSAGMPVTTKSNKAANSKPMVAMSKPKVQVAGKIKPKVAAGGRSPQGPRNRHLSARILLGVP